MEITWLHGNYMETVWKLFENCLEIVWRLHGNYLEITWRLHLEYLTRGMASGLSIAGARYEDMYDLSSDGCRKGQADAIPSHI
jgi:hypothetical protein